MVKYHGQKKGSFFFFSLVWRKHPFRYFSAEASVPIVIAPRTLSELKSAHLNAGKVTGIEIILQP